MAMVESWTSTGPGAALVAGSLEKFPSLLVLFKFLLLLKIRFTFLVLLLLSNFYC